MIELTTTDLLAKIGALVLERDALTGQLAEQDARIRQLEELVAARDPHAVES